MSSVGTVIVGTLSEGSTLALISAGFVVLYRATRVVSFAQGLFMVVGAELFAGMINRGFGLYPSLVLAAAAAAVLSAGIFRGILARLQGVTPFVTAISTIGIATAGLAITIIIAGPNNVILNKGTVGFKNAKFIGLTFTHVELFEIAMTLTVFIVLVLGIQRTHVGLSMRAVADHAVLADYTGVSTARMSMFAWGIAGAVGALAGCAFTMINQPTPNSVYSLGLAAFPAILLGGFDSIVGALVGSLLLALIQNITVQNLGGQWQDAISYGVLLVVLLLRPQGLLGSREVQRL